MFDKDLKESLMEAVKFTDADLEANRNGTVTEAQRAKLGKTLGMTRGATILGFGLFIIVIVAIGVYFFVFSDSGKALLQSNSDDTPVGPIVVGVLAAVVVIIFLSSLRTLTRMNDMARGKVSVAEGTAKLKTYSERTGIGIGMRSYQIKIGKTNFHVQSAVFNAFVEGGSYRVFYIKMPPIHTILSVEQL